MLEDESGRLRLIGTPLHTSMLVTGCIIAVMGTENANGDFEIVDLKVPDLPRQPQRWERDDTSAQAVNGNRKIKANEHLKRIEGGKVAMVSGLAISGEVADTLSMDLLMEYLLGEACVPSIQKDVARISRLLIVGNSITEGTPLDARDELPDKRASKKYGYDASAYNPAPTAHLDEFLATLLPSIPITLLPGESDPANVSLPQQPIHPAMFPRSRAYAATPGSDEQGWFDSVTNPWEGDIDGWRMNGTGGQPVDDIFKYIEGDERLEIMENLLRWRCLAPTAPDTLCEFSRPQVLWIHHLKTAQEKFETLILVRLHRVLSISRERPVCHRGVSARLLCRQSTTVRDHSHWRSCGPGCTVNCCAQIQGNGRAGAA